MASDTFFSTYKLEEWDFGQLPGPFPRQETLCIIRRSSCSSDDASCLSPVSLEQIACEDTACLSGACTRTTVLVDQNDVIVNQKTASASNDTTDDAQSSATSRTDDSQTGDRRSLGCFDSAGSWTTDRSRCAGDQKRYVNPAVSDGSGGEKRHDPQQRKEWEQKIEREFVSDTRKNAIVEHLLSSTTEATGRIERILENPSLPDDTRVALEAQQEQLRIAQHTASEPDQSVRDLQLLANTVTERLETVQKTVTVWASTSRPLTVTDRLDHLFVTLPSIFNILLQAQLPLESKTAEAYIGAQQLYEPVREDCLADAVVCRELSRVLDALEPVFLDMKMLIDQSGRTDLEQQIKLLLAK